MPAGANTSVTDMSADAGPNVYALQGGDANSVQRDSGSWTLGKKQAKGLFRRVQNRASHATTEEEVKQAAVEAAEAQEQDHDGDAKGHDHHEKPPSLANAVASAVINFLLMFGLCCAYGMIMFADDFNQRHRGLAIKMNLGTAFLIGLLLAIYSKVPVAIGGPDLNPVVFLGGMVHTISAAIAESLELDILSTVSSSSSSHRMLGTARMLGGGGGSSSGPLFCDTYWIAHSVAPPGGRHLEDLCEDYHVQLRATVIFTTVATSAILGSIFFLLGTFKLSRYVSYVPTSVQEAFLSCIGYKVFKYALEFCQYDLNQFIPAACVGVPLYFMKAYHIGNPAIVMPLGLLVPLGIFYAIVYGKGSNVEEMRAADWFFPEIPNAWWTLIYEDGYFKADKINFKACTKALPDVFIMIIVIVLDCMLKISSTETKMPVKTDKNYEITLYGMGNILTTLTGQTVGYMQLKFNVINYGVLGNVKDRRAGIIYSLMCGFCFFYSTELINYLPRLFLGSLLFFAGAGFVCENLWGSRKYLNFGEWLEILIILGVFILTGQLLYAVGVGVVLTGVGFIRKCAAVSAISGRPLHGAEVITHGSRGPLVQKSLEHIANSWLLVTKLHGFVFFASVQRVTDSMIMRIEDEKQLPEYERMKYLVFDCEQLDGLDVSAAKAMKKLTAEAATMGVHVYFAQLSPQLVKDFVMREIITHEKDIFPSLGEVVVYIEERVLVYCNSLHVQWVDLHPAFKLNKEMQLANAGPDPFHGILIGDSSRFNSPWRYCSKMKITGYRDVLFLNGQVDGNLYLVHAGMIGLFDNLPGKDSNNPDDWASPSKIYGHGRFLNIEALAGAQSHACAVALRSGEVVYWSQEQWWRMSREQPIMVRDILRAVMKQQVNEKAAGSVAAQPQLNAVKDRAGDSPLCKTRTAASSASTGSEAGKSGKVPAFRSRSTLEKVKDTLRGHSSVSASSFEVHDEAMTKIIAGPKKQDHTTIDKDLLPRELLLQLQELEVAHCLSDRGFFDVIPAGEVASHPEMPVPVRRDLHNAFVTFCTVAAEEAGGKDATLPWGSITNALKYAGIFNTLLVDDDQKHPESLKEAEFMSLAHSAAMAKLSKNNVEVIHAIFRKFDKDGSNSLDLGELGQVFQKEMHPGHGLNVDTVDGIAAGFTVSDTAGVGKVTKDGFTMIMSRYIKKHEHHWVLLQGILAVFGKTYGEVTSDTISHTEVERAVEENGHPETVAQVKELLWAADWLRSGTGGGLDLTFDGFVAALNTFFLIPVDHCPPQVAPGTCGIFEAPPKTQPALGFNADDLLLNFHTALAPRQGPRASTKHSTLHLDDVSDDEVEVSSQKELPLKMRIYRAFEEPNSSNVAAVVSTVTSVLILISVILLIIQPIVRTTDPSPQEEAVWFAFECFFTIIFTIELLIRFAVCNADGVRTRCDFIITPGNVTDFVAIIPGWLDIALGSGEESMRLLRIIRMARISRMARVARLANKSSLAAPVSMVLVVIWGIYMKHGLSE